MAHDRGLEIGHKKIARRITAILDRVVHNAYRLELDGPSKRKIKASEENVSTSSFRSDARTDGKH